MSGQGARDMFLVFAPYGMRGGLNAFTAVMGGKRKLCDLPFST
ncbi:hypothetical protein J2S28_005753 [Rhizobium sp. SLBN-94]|nr:hypothetical protein [Rhizobium sp. SLBN-94]